MIITNQNAKKFLDFAGAKLHAPEQKIALTATALAIQPAIDMSNTKVDKETRKVSAARDVAKLIAGAITGISIRYIGIEVAKRLAKFTPILDSTKKYMYGVEKGCGILIPKKFIGANGIKNKYGKDGITKIPVADFQNSIMKYIKAMGTTLATAIMLYTNFSFDAPKTKDWTPIAYKGMFREELGKSKTPKKNDSPKETSTPKDKEVK